jgi:hypothetical protein
MRTKRRVEIRVETDRVLVIGRPGTVSAAWCEACARRVAMVPVDVAAILAGTSARAIYGRVEAGALHFAETPAGALLICVESL